MARSRIALDGLPHSEISGSKPVCGSPKLIAAYHVLLRRPAPRHPPYALSSLTTTFTLLEHCSRQFMPYVHLLLIQDLRLSMNPGPSARCAVAKTPPAEALAGEARPLAATMAAQTGVVELTGFEPATSALQGRRSPN